MGIEVRSQSAETGLPGVDIKPFPGALEATSSFGSALQRTPSDLAGSLLDGSFRGSNGPVRQKHDRFPILALF